MPNPIDKVKHFYSLIKNKDLTVDRVRHKASDLPELDLPFGGNSVEHTVQRRAFLNEKGHFFPYLTGDVRVTDPSIFDGNIEQFIGMTRIPTGVVGPLHI